MGFHVIMVLVVLFVALAMHAMASAAVNPQPLAALSKSHAPVTMQSSRAGGSH